MSSPKWSKVFLRLIKHVIKDGELEDYTNFPWLTEPKCSCAEPLKQDATGTASLELVQLRSWVFVIGGLPDPTLIRLDFISTEDKRVCMMDLSSALWRAHTRTHTLKGVCSHSAHVPNFHLLVGLVVQHASDPCKPGLSCERSTLTYLRSTRGLGKA